MRILIVEDDETIAQSLQIELEKWQYETKIVDDFNHIIETFEFYAPHIVLLDITLPAFNGYYWCQEIRKQSNVPIVFISSRSDSMDQVMAMQMGGDDFIEKPFNMSVTVSKIQAMLRRSYDFIEVKNELKVNNVLLNMGSAFVKAGDEEISLTNTELQIMTILFQNKGVYVSRNALIEKCWESEFFIDDNTLAVNMTRLRKKLQKIGLTNFIETKKNVGYRVVE